MTSGLVQAAKQGDTWKGALDTPQAQAGIADYKRLFDSLSKAPADTDEATPQQFEVMAKGNVAMMVGLPWELNSAAGAAPKLMPALTATVVWQWLFDTQFGVVNWLLTTLRLGSFTGHSWFATGLSTFAVITIIVVWQAIPFVAITLYAGLTAVPRELREAMRVDGAGPWRAFWSLLLPALRPLFMVTCFLSIIWDFKVFTQVWLVRQGGPNRQTVTLAVYAYQEGIATSHFGRAAAISLVMVVLLLTALVYYIRLMLRTQEDL